MTTTLYTFVPDEPPDAVVDAGLADLWRQLDGYHWPSPIAEGVLRRELIRAAETGGLNAMAIQRSIDSLKTKLPTSLGPVPGVAERLKTAMNEVVVACRRLVDDSRRDDESSEIAKVRRLAEVKWTYIAVLAELDRRVAAVMAAARTRVAATPAAVDRHGERFSAAVAELSMLLSAGATAPILIAWQRAVDRRQRAELEAWSGVPSVLRSWTRQGADGTYPVKTADGGVELRAVPAAGTLASTIELQLEEIIDELRTPAEKAATEAKYAVQREEELLEIAYTLRPGLVALVQ